MGHEFVEMKNTPAAAQVYRIAVDINPNDYRAWYECPPGVSACMRR